MLLREAVEIFIEKHHRNEATGSISPSKARKELARFVRHCEAQIASCEVTMLSEEMLASYLAARAKKSSGQPGKSVTAVLRQLLEFLAEERLNDQGLAAFLPALTSNKHKAASLLRQLQELEELLLDSARLEQTQKKIAKIKKEIKKILRKHSSEATAVLDLGERKISALQRQAKAEKDKGLQELSEAGEAAGFKITELNDLLQELSALTKGVAKLGKEQYKVQTAIVAKQQKEEDFFKELQHRLARSERQVEELVKLRQDLYRQVGLEMIKELLPVIDGIENAIAFSSSLNGRTPAPSKLAGSLFHKFFSSRAPIAEIAAVDLRQWVEGLEIIRDRLLALLKKSGVEPIPSLGQKFDPQLHLAVAAESRDGAESNVILKEQLKGYRRENEIIRFAEVVVAK